MDFQNFGVRMMLILALEFLQVSVSNWSKYKVPLERNLFNSPSQTLIHIIKSYNESTHGADRTKGSPDYFRGVCVPKPFTDDVLKIT